MQTKRRDFIKTLGLTSLALAPGMDVLGKLVKNPNQQSTGVFVNYAFRLFDHRNLLSAEFYFINTALIGGRMFRRDENSRFRESYMVVRLPQQHISEGYMPEDLLEKNKQVYAVTRIASYSYLVFRIDYDLLGKGVGFEVNAKELLNWNKSYYRLVVRQNLDKEIFLIYAGGSHENVYPLGYTRDGSARLKYSRHNFPKAYSNLETNTGHGANETSGKPVDPAPITAIEAPYGLILSPQLPDQDNYAFHWSFSLSVDIDECKTGTELWMGTLTIKPVPRKPKPPTNEVLGKPVSDLREEQQDKGDELMRLMMIGKKQNTDDEEQPPLRGTDLMILKSYLPAQVDRKDLVDLYINFKLTARTKKLSFTPLGISADIEFKNTLYKEIVESDIAEADKPDLYEWSQKISFGRDQEVKVAHVVVDACTGLKMLRILTTRRATYQGTSLLVYREFLKPLDEEKDYTLYEHSANINKYKDPNYKCNTPFKKIAFVDKKPRQILRVSGMIDDKPSYVVYEEKDQPLAFWALTPDRKLLEWELDFTDWHNNTTRQKKKLFVLTHYLAPTEKEGKKYPFPGPDMLTVTVSPLNSAGTAVLSLQEFESTLLPNLPEQSSPADNVWKQIAIVSEDFSIQKIDNYRLYLEAALQNLENRVRAIADLLEDQVMEEFGVFKRRILEIKSLLIEGAERVRYEVNGIFSELNSGLQALQDKVNEFNNIVNELLNAFETSYRDLVDNEDKKLKPLRDALKAKGTALINDIIARIGSDSRVKRLQELRQKLDELAHLPVLNRELEKEYEAFLTRIPRVVRNKIERDVKSQFKDVIECVYRIRNLENSLKSRINFYKSKIGYAVYGVEEDLEALKTRIKEKFKGLQYQQAKWEEEYLRVREELFKAHAKILELQTEFVLFRNNIRQKVLLGGEKVLDFFHEYTCYPQLHTAKVYVKAINDLVQKEIPVKIKFAEDYFRTQVHDIILDTKNNVTRVFAEIRSDAKELVKGAIREISHELGGIMNPDLAADYLTYAKDLRDQVTGGIEGAKDEVDKVLTDMKEGEEALKRQIDQIRNEIKNNVEEFRNELRDDLKPYADELMKSRNNLILLGKEAKQNFERYRDFAKMEAKDFFKGLEAKILGGIHLRDILGDGFELPKLDRKSNKVVYHFVTNKLKPVNLGIFSFDNKGGRSKLVIYFEKSLSNSRQFRSWTALNEFEIGIFDNRLLIEFEKLQIFSDENVKNKLAVKISNVGFKKKLAYLESLSKNIKIPGTGLTLNITPQQIAVNFAYAVPGIMGGGFTMTNLKFGVGVILPLPIGGKSSISPLIARFGINAPDDKFVVAAGIWGGRGHFVIEATPKYLRLVDAGMDFGGYLGLDLGIAKGEAFLMAGVRFVYKRFEDGSSMIELYATLTCGGSVTVFGFITISVVFLLCLRYQRFQGRTSLYGTASVTYSIKIGFLKKSFSLAFTRRLHGTEDGAASNELAHLPNGYKVQYAHNNENSRRIETDYDPWEDPEQFNELPEQESLLTKYNRTEWNFFCTAFEYDACP